MKHAFPDYDRIQDPALYVANPFQEINPIPQDEPVFLVRAQDVAFIPTLQAWIYEHLQSPDFDPALVNLVKQHIELAKKWQAEHATKTADLIARE